MGERGVSPPRSDEHAVANAPRSPGALTALQPRISWDRVHQRLQALLVRRGGNSLYIPFRNDGGG